MRTASYLVRKPTGIYHFRIFVPHRFRQSLGKREIVKSLNTREPRLARILAAPFLDAATILFSSLASVNPMFIDRKRAMAQLGINPDEIGQFVSMKAGGIEIVVGTPGDQTTPEQIAEAKKMFADVAAVAATQPMVVSAQPSIAPQNLIPHTDHTLIENFHNYKLRRQEKWDDRTKQVYEYQFKTMFGLMGVSHARLITRTVADNLVHNLIHYPVRATQNEAFKGLSQREIVSLNLKLKDEVLSPKTVNEYIGRMTTFINYCIAAGQFHSDGNPFPALKVAEPPREESSYRAFEPDELKLIFHTDFFKKRLYKRSWHYWIPHIGLFTGARLNEICGLTINDIVDVNGLPCFKFDFRENDKHRLKNRPSIRKIPIHPKLIELGFMDFVNSVKSKNKILLFGLSKGRDGYIKRPSDWFSKYKIKIGLTDPKLKFHSFRDTAQVCLQLTTKVSAELRSAYLGHSTAKGAELDGGSRTTMQNYGTNYPPELLVDSVVKYINYPELELLPYKPI